VSGLETPDPYTLVIRLAEPFGGLDYLADASWSPIPAQLAEGHDDDLGLQWPTSGPYMHETVPADPTSATAAYVRNPAWSREEDGNRPALVDRIEIVRVVDMADGLAKLDAGEVDFLSERLEVEAAQRYRADASTTQRVRSSQSEYLYQFPMNIAVPPFDDVAVRRAVTFAIDRVTASAAVVEGRVVNGFPRLPTVLSAHMFSDSVSDGLLLAYDPYGLGDGRGNITRARTEMARSQYDSDGDGLCDADVCANLDLPTFDAASGEAIARSLETIGILAQPIPLDDQNDMSVPQNRASMNVFPYGWGFDLTGQEMAILVQGGDALAAGGFVINASLVGARPEELQAWGYPVTSVPGVDDVIDRCNSEAGRRRAACWAELDQLLAESVVPWTPLFAYESVYVSSARVANYVLDQTAHQQFPALDKVSLVAGAE
jgi:ABC-type transport system substrate-binding protein